MHGLTKTGVFFFLILTELLAIYFLGVHLHRLRQQTTNPDRIPISKDSVQFTPAGSLREFYEWKPNQTVVRQESWLPHTITMTTNSDTIVGNKEYLENAEPHVFRIMTLGDSFTEGTFVDPDHSYPRQLETLLNTKLLCPDIQKFEVINLGVGGYDIEYAAHRYLTRGQKYHPNLILWLLKDDDFLELADLTRSGVVRHMATMSEKDKQALTDQGIVVWDHVYDIVKEEIAHTISQKQFETIQTHAIRSITQTESTPIVLATFPTTNPIYKKLMKQWSNTELHVSFIDTIRDPNTLHATFYPNDGHPTADGYAIIAKDIYDYLKTHTVPFCSEKQ